jgi:Domain of unknown function (DUF4062)
MQRRLLEPAVEARLGVMSRVGSTAPGAMVRPQRVFLSHTSELREFPSPLSFVGAAESAVARARFAVTDQAYLAAGDRGPARACRQAISESDIYLGIIGFRYGSLAREHPRLSYTELEFATATALRMPRLVVLLDEHGIVPLPADQIIDHLHGTRQAAFRRRLRLESGLTIACVATPQELETAVYQALVEIAHHCSSPLPFRPRGGRPARHAVVR